MIPAMIIAGSLSNLFSNYIVKNKRKTNENSNDPKTKSTQQYSPEAPDDENLETLKQIETPANENLKGLQLQTKSTRIRKL